MSTENLNQVNDIGGATAKSLGVPQPTPIFEWEVNNGIIKVYHLFNKIATISFDDGVQNQVYGSTELKGTPNLDAVSLVFDGVVHYPALLKLNPFAQLLEEPKAMKELSKLLQQI